MRLISVQSQAFSCAFARWSKIVFGGPPIRFTAQVQRNLARKSKKLEFGNFLEAAARAAGVSAAQICIILSALLLLRCELFAYKPLELCLPLLHVFHCCKTDLVLFWFCPGLTPWAPSRKLSWRQLTRRTPSARMQRNIKSTKKRSTS